MYLTESQVKRLEALRDRGMMVIGYTSERSIELVSDMTQELDNILGLRKPKDDLLEKSSGITMPLGVLRTHASAKGLDLFEIMGWDWGGRARELSADERINLNIGQAVAFGLMEKPMPEPAATPEPTCLACDNEGCYRCQPTVYRKATDRDLMMAAGAPNGMDRVIDDELERYGVRIDG